MPGSKIALIFALAAAPLAAQTAANLPDHPMPRIVPQLRQNKLIFMPPPASPRSFCDRAENFLSERAGQQDAGFGLNVQHGIAGRLSFRMGETWAPGTISIPPADGIGAGLVFRLDRKP